MKFTNLYIFTLFTEVLNILTSRQRLKWFLTTPLYSNACYLMAGSAIMAILSFFFWVVVARFYTEIELGFSSAIISAIIFLAIVSMVGLDASLIRFLPQNEKPQQLINSSFTLVTFISLVIAGIFVAGVDFWSPALSFIKGDVVFSAAFIVFTPLWALFGFTSATFIARRRAGFVLSTKIIFSALKIPLPIFFVLFFHSFGIVASWGIALGIAVAVSLLLFLPKVQNHYKPVPTLNLKPIKDVWRYSSGNYLFSLMTAALPMVLPIMVVNMLGPVQNAYFYITWMIASLLYVIPISTSLSLFAEGSHFEVKLRENATKSIKFTFLLLVPAVIFLILVGKWLLLAFGQSYSVNGLGLFLVLCLSSLPFGINYIYASFLRVTHRIKELVTIWGLIAVSVLVTSYLVIPSTGIIGIGYVWLGAQGITAVYTASALRLRLSHYCS